MFYLGLDIHDRRITICVLSKAGLKSHPEVRHGAWRHRGREWERPHTLSRRPAMADDAE
jgi:hypothetical protein